ncbi:MAG: Zn-ribbon domain-containing protein [Candidatus Methanoperedens sp.]|nr:Zn-ribbon domain-containing protein [Candidatus Methanoperedens sp.]MCZ7358529.1 Zn-ribbon domain-containing protein [Candidatus Methanoperedens sp.]HLB71373.1 Zn-ribbon domain-containing protein [Candidatus Methanoperedens sp.]
MPHKCTRCESIFKDGAAIILNGCPKCGWNKFFYVRDPSGPSQIGSNGTIPPAASKFIKEVDELLGKTPQVQSESKETKVETRPQEVGERVESVRILSPGQYELNLDSILKREEIVMALKEDGTYIVHLPSVFQKKKHHER